jgi:twitching motility protein PilT
MPFNLKEIIDAVVNDGASDLHFSVGLPPLFRVKKQLLTKEGYAPLSTDDINYFLSQILSEEQRKIFEINKELFMSVNFGNNVRFRVTVFNTKGGYPAVALRTIPFHSPDIDKLNLPPIVKKAADFKQGLVLVTGPTGQGKSTTIAGIIEKINEVRNEHIVTIEDPIEFLFESKKSFIQQMEVSIDTLSWNTSLKSISRVDPDVVMVGEINDAESLLTALNLAETGHLVLSTLHTNSASQTVDRIISSFPEAMQAQVRNQLSLVLEMVISQRLIETLDGDLLPACEVLISNSATRNLIRENKIYAIDNIIATSANLGMITLDSSLAELVNSGKVSLNNAIRYSLSPENLTRMVKK